MKRISTDLNVADIDRLLTQDHEVKRVKNLKQTTKSKIPSHIPVVAKSGVADINDITRNEHIPGTIEDISPTNDTTQNSKRKELIVKGMKSYDFIAYQIATVEAVEYRDVMNCTLEAAATKFNVSMWSIRSFKKGPKKFMLKQSIFSPIEEEIFERVALSKIIFSGQLPLKWMTDFANALLARKAEKSIELSKKDQNNLETCRGVSDSLKAEYARYKELVMQSLQSTYIFVPDYQICEKSLQLLESSFEERFSERDLTYENFREVIESCDYFNFISHPDFVQPNCPSQYNKLNQSNLQNIYLTPLKDDANNKSAQAVIMAKARGKARAEIRKARSQQIDSNFEPRKSSASSYDSTKTKNVLTDGWPKGFMKRHERLLFVQMYQKKAPIQGQDRFDDESDWYRRLYFGLIGSQIAPENFFNIGQSVVLPADVTVPSSQNRNYVIEGISADGSALPPCFILRSNEITKHDIIEKYPSAQVFSFNMEMKADERQGDGSLPLEPYHTWFNQHFLVKTNKSSEAGMKPRGILSYSNSKFLTPRFVLDALASNVYIFPMPYGIDNITQPLNYLSIEALESEWANDLTHRESYTYHTEISNSRYSLQIFRNRTHFPVEPQLISCPSSFNNIRQAFAQAGVFPLLPFSYSSTGVSSDHIAVPSHSKHKEQLKEEVKIGMSEELDSRFSAKKLSQIPQKDSVTNNIDTNSDLEMENVIRISPVSEEQQEKDADLVIDPELENAARALASTGHITIENRQPTADEYAIHTPASNDSIEKLDFSSSGQEHNPTYHFHDPSTNNVLQQSSSLGETIKQSESYTVSQKQSLIDSQCYFRFIYNTKFLESIKVSLPIHFALPQPKDFYKVTGNVAIKYPPSFEKIQEKILSKMAQHKDLGDYNEKNKDSNLQG